MFTFMHIVFLARGSNLSAQCYRLSFCPSVTQVDLSKTVEARIMQFSSYVSSVYERFLFQSIMITSKYSDKTDFWCLKLLLDCCIWTNRYLWVRYNIILQSPTFMLIALHHSNCWWLHHSQGLVLEGHSSWGSTHNSWIAAVSHPSKVVGKIKKFGAFLLKMYFWASFGGGILPPLLLLGNLYVSILISRLQSIAWDVLNHVENKLTPIVSVLNS